MEHVAYTHVGGVRTTFGNVALRIDSKLSWAARSGRPFPEGLPCLWGEATTKLKAGSAPPGVRLGDLGWEGSLLAWTTRGGRRVAIFQAIPLNSKKSRSEKSQDPGSFRLGGGGVGASVPVQFWFPASRSLASESLLALKFHLVDAGERAPRFSLCLPKGFTTFLANLPNQQGWRAHPLQPRFPVWMERQSGRRVTGNATAALLAEAAGCEDRTYFVFDSCIVETARFPGNRLTRVFSGVNPSLVYLSPSPFRN